VEGLAGVSVVASHCLIAGTASTLAMLKGAAEGPRFLAELGLPHVHVTREGTTGGTLARVGRAPGRWRAGAGRGLRSGPGRDQRVHGVVPVRGATSSRRDSDPR